MKISKYIFLFTISFCMAVQGMTLSQFCIGPDHSESKIDWASNCHSQKDDDHDSHNPAFDHTDAGCIDISVAIAGSPGSSHSHDQATATKPVIIKSSMSGHPFSSADYSKLKPSLFPAHTDTTTLSLASTILII